MKLWIGLLGYGLSIIIWTAFSRPRPGAHQPHGLSFFPDASSTFWLFIPIAVLFRFGWLVAFHHWPVQDDSHHAFIAMDLAQHWRWDLILSFDQIPPLHLWWEAAFFKILKPSFETLWLGPAVLSALTACVSYPCARAWFSKKESLLLSLLWSISLGPAFVGRFCLPQVPFLFWELCALGGLGYWKRFLGTPKERTASCVYGFCLGMGAWTHYHWFLTIPLLAVAIYRFSKGRFQVWAILSLSMILPIIPIFITGFSNDWGRYLINDSGMKHGLSFLPQCVEALRYVSALFWGVDGGSFRPFWGGFLNPVAGSLVLLGIWKAPQYFGRSRAVFVYCFLLSGLLPGFLTAPAEYLRMVHVFPFLTLLSFFGLQFLSQAFIPSRRLTFWLCLLLLSAILDSYHLFKMQEQWVPPAANWASKGKTPSLAQAYEILQSLRPTDTKGWALSRFMPNSDDVSFTLACSPWAPQKTEKAEWVALLLEKNIAQVLLKENPQGCVYPLCENPSQIPGKETALFYLKRSESNDPVFEKGGWVERWSTIDWALTPVLRDAIRYREENLQPVFKDFQKTFPMISNDPLMECLLWSRVSEFYKLQAAVFFNNPRLLGKRNLASSNAALLSLRILALRHAYSLVPTPSDLVELEELEKIARALEQNGIPLDTNILSEFAVLPPTPT